MADMNEAGSAGPIIATSQLLAQHRNEASRSELVIERLTAFVAHPLRAAWFAALILAWIGGNLVAAANGALPLDPPPFFWLQGAISLCSLMIALLLLSSQRREGVLASRRDNLILEMVIQAEQKSAKAIELLEEARRDNPLLRDRNDPQAEQMAVPTDHVIVLGAIREENPGK